REPGTLEGHTVSIVPFRRGKDYSQYSGFTYFLPCTRKNRAKPPCMLTAREGVVYLEKPEALSGSLPSRREASASDIGSSTALSPWPRRNVRSVWPAWASSRRKQTEPPVLPELLLV